MKIISILITVFLLIITVSPVYARSGCCSYHGGVCGCDCCDGTPLSSTCAPYYPECNYDSGYSYTPLPSCPLFSFYNITSGKCECYSGYVASGGSCISATQYCQNKYGWNAQYNSLDQTCECSYGYVLDSSGTQCVSGNQVCWNKYGFNSSYDSLNGTCKCSYNYVFNKAGTKCISQDDYCKEEFGFASKSDLLGNCVCMNGYKFDGSQCVPEVNKPTFIPSINNSPTPTKFISTPTPESQLNNKLTPTPPPYNLSLDFQKAISINDSGQEVIRLQTILATDKTIYPEDIISGFYGPATQTAVKRFQEKYGLGVTGSADLQTLEKIKEVYEPSPTPVPSPTPQKGSSWQEGLTIWMATNVLLKWLLPIF